MGSIEIQPAFLILIRIKWITKKKLFLKLF